MSWQLTMVLMLAITVGAAVFVAWPLLTGRARPEEFFEMDPSEPVLEQLMSQRDTTYAAMKELEDDLAMGNLSQQDFEQLQERYKRRAVAILRRIDEARAGRLPAGSILDDLEEDEEEEPEEEHRPLPQRRGSRAAEASIDLDLEQEIEAFRGRSREQTRTAPPARSLAPAPQAPRGASLAPRGTSPAPRFCSSCGSPVKDQEAAFCSRCGASLRPKAGPRRPQPPRGR